MDKPFYRLVGAPCGQHGQYTFYKALRLTGEKEHIIAIGDFFFVRIWQDSELVSIGELQLLWTDRVSDQTLVSLRLYFLPENTPEGRSQHGEDEVLAINDKVVVRAEDLLSWICDGSGWRWGLRGVWRGACAPPAAPRHTQPLHHTRLDFTDVDREKSAIAVDADSPGVVVFSYPRYCRYRALVSRLEGIQADWLRDSLVAALGGYAAPTKNTRILYCKDTFEYPELEGHEFVCNHLAPRLKGRPRGRRRRAARSRSHSPSSPSSDSDTPPATQTQQDPDTPRRLSLRNGPSEKQSEDEGDKSAEHSAEDKAFLSQLKRFYKERNETIKGHSLKDLSLRALYRGVAARGGYAAVCRRKLWRAVRPHQPARARRHYERFLLPFENHERRNGTGFKPNGRIEAIDTIDVPDSPQHDTDNAELADKRLRTPSPKIEIRNTIDNETGEFKEEINVISKPAEELNREFLDSLPKPEEKLKEERPVKIHVKPVEKLIEPPISVCDDSASERSDVAGREGGYFSELAQKLHLGNSDTTFLKEIARAQQDLVSNTVIPGHALTVASPVNGHAVNGASTTTTDQKSNRPVGRSSLRAVRVKPTRPQYGPAPNTPPSIPPHRPDSASSSPPAPPPLPPPLPQALTAPQQATTINNFGIHHPPQVTSTNSHSDDEIVEVPYKPKTPEIIDLDEYPESPQSVKKKKLEILKERGLEVTALPTWSQPITNPIPPLIAPNNVLLNPAMQHQIMTQAQLFQMYNIIPQNYNGIQPPRIVQSTSIFGSSGPQKTVYGNPKDPFMPPPHVLQGVPIKPQRSVQTATTLPQDILDLTCKNAVQASKPAVEIVRVPTAPSPKSTAQNLTKNYTLVDGKAVVGSNLEITLVNKAPLKNRPPQKRSSNGKFVSTKTPTPPKDYPKPYATPSPKKPTITVPNYPLNRDDVSPTSSTGSRDSQTNMQNLQNAYKNHSNVSQIMDMQKSMPMTPFVDPYMAIYSSFTNHMDQRQLAMYRDFMANQFRGYSGLLNMGTVANTPTTKN